jgi:Amt family ammonium transporter
LIEIGINRKPFTSHSLVKNFVQFSAGILAFWLIGFAFAFGDSESRFIGERLFGGDDWVDEKMFRCFSFAGLAGIFVVFIVNTAVSERISYVGSVALAVFIMGFAWPVVVCWNWADGWLMKEMDESIQDLGGSITIYTFAGGFSLISSILTGQRPGRFDNSVPAHKFDSYNYEFYIIGCMLTILGCFGIGFAQMSPSHYGYALANMWICGGVSCLLSNRLLCLWSVSLNTNLLGVFHGFIAGMAVISSSAGNTTAWQAGLHGILAALMFVAAVKFEDWVKLDDPAHVFATFLIPGICGGILPGFIDDQLGVYWAGWESGQMLGTQTVATVVVVLWSAVWAYLCLGSFWMAGILNMNGVFLNFGAKGAGITQSGYEFTIRSYLGY